MKQQYPGQVMGSLNDNYRKIRFILGDQLNEGHSWFDEIKPDVLYVLAELHAETAYVSHHVLKVCAIFAAMQAFAGKLQKAGHHVKLLSLDDTKTTPGVSDLLQTLVQQHQTRELEYQQPDEFRLSQELSSLDLPGVNITRKDTEHFLLPHSELPSHFERDRPARMENFYRMMRKRYGFLMEDGKPVGGQWNFDSANRKALRKQDLPAIPEPLCFDNDMGDILDRLSRNNVSTIGNSSTPLTFPTSRKDSLTLLDYFCEKALPRFGTFQDAMSQEAEQGWSLFHSRLSFSLNTKMLSPKEVIETAINTFERRDDIELSQIEGFVRQILGWREFVRGIYWANMPGYDQLNYLSAKRKLPGFFWTGETKLNCISQVVKQSLDYSYAHHIQRLMVTGVFGLIAGIDPSEMDRWYLGIYADAFQWVELPNTRGMSQFADGGIIASKPYAASGNYINKMSDYCKHCAYEVKERTSEKSCPLNALYWDFLARHSELLDTNARLSFAYRNWNRFDTSTRSAIRSRAADILINLENI
jgi:deoxyribodipyrimidine photolyase-related protein